ncbi:MAG: YceI family protein [Ilumatobacteraceae bacterium]
MALLIAPGTYPIDTTHSQIAFSIRHLGISTIRGTFDTYRGELCVGADLAGTVVAVAADTASINSGNRWRDEHMFGPEWLDVDDHPEMAIRSTSITESVDGYTMTGDLTIKGITNPVTFDVVYHGSNTFPMDGSTHFGFEATGSVMRSAFGVSTAIPLLSDEVKLFLDVQFVLPAPTA